MAENTALGMAGKAVVNTHINVGGVAQQASFSVDIEQIPRLVASYRDAQDKLREIRDLAGELRSIPPPGEDEVSKQLVKNLGEMAGDGEGCLTAAVQDAYQRLQSQIEHLEAAQREYQNTDDSAKV